VVLTVDWSYYRVVFIHNFTAFTKKRNYFSCSIHNLYSLDSSLLSSCYHQHLPGFHLPLSMFTKYATIMILL